MNLWRAWAPATNLGSSSRRVVWATSERAVRALAKNEFGDTFDAANIKSIELSTTKAELVEWLNANVNNIVVGG